MKLPIIIGVAAASAMGATPIALHASHIFGTYEPPASCRAWYDGCNMCEKATDGTITCTARTCSEYAIGFCRMHFPLPTEGAQASAASGRSSLTGSVTP